MSEQTQAYDRCVAVVADHMSAFDDEVSADAYRAKYDGLPGAREWCIDMAEIIKPHWRGMDEEEQGAVLQSLQMIMSLVYVYRSPMSHGAMARRMMEKLEDDHG